MALYELRTYQVVVGRMNDVFAAYKDKGWPAIQGGGFDKKLIGYFISYTGPAHQVVHLWKVDDDNDSRNHWKRLYADDAFMAFAAEFRPMLTSQHIQLLNAAPWSPQP